MKLTFRLPLLPLVLYCVTQALGVQIQSYPEVNGDGVIQTELNQTVSLICLSDKDPESEDSKELVWLRNEEKIQLNDENRQGNSSVCITPVILDDNDATFTCRLSTNATEKASVTLKVTYSPHLSGSEEFTVEEESKLVLECNIVANPPVSSVLWTLNGSSVDLLAGGFTLTNDGQKSQLTTNNVAKSMHEGTYQCKAESPKYGEYSKTFTVSVIDKTLTFPLIPIIAGVVVVVLTALLAAFSRRKKILKCFKKGE